MGLEGMRVICRGTPNKRYHGHTGVVIRELVERYTGEELLEIRWDIPSPVEDVKFQVMRIDNIFIDSDVHGLISDHPNPNIVIEEEPF